MITFIAHVRVKPENVPAYEALMTHVRDSSRANEPGIVYYDFGKSAEEPEVYCVIEVYRDAAAHAAHMETPWVRDSIPESRRLVDGGFNIRQYVSPGTAPAVRRMQEREDD